MKSKFWTLLLAAFVIAGVTVPASAALVYSQEVGSEGNFGYGITTTTWYLAEVSLGGTERLNPTVTLDLSDTAGVASRDITMYLFAGDGSSSTPVAGTLTPGMALATDTVTVADLGSSSLSPTTVTWNFTGVVPTNLIVALEIANSDGTGQPAYLRGVGGPVTGIGTHHGINASTDDGFSWLVVGGNDVGFGYVNFTIDAQVPEPAAGLLALLGLTALGWRRRTV